MVKFDIIKSKQEVDVSKLLELHANSTVGIRNRESLEVALAKCHRYIVIAKDNTYIAAGRSISDGTYTFVLELVVAEAFKRQGYGKIILQELLKGEEKNYVYLTSTWEAENFYQKAGFKRHKTAYAKYPKPSEYLQEDS